MLDEITTYAGDAEWESILTRLCARDDDGHAVKLGRAVAFGEVACREFEGEGWARVKGGMWGKVGNMVVDSVEGPGSNWVRSAGFEEAWTGFGERTRRENL